MKIARFVRRPHLASLLAVVSFLGPAPPAVAAEPLQVAVRRLVAEPGAEPGRRDGRSLAVVHLDGDGARDLAVGEATAEGGLIRGYLGVEDRRGRLGFGSGQVLATLPIAPDLLAAGDFDRDGRVDLVAASREVAELWWLRGQVDGRFSAPLAVRLAASPTALVAGSLDLADGLDDLAVAVADGRGSRLLLYRSEEALFAGGTPAVVGLREPVRELRLGDLAGGGGRDLLALGDSLATLVHGEDRPGEEKRAPRREEIDRLEIDGATSPARLGLPGDEGAPWVELHTNTDALADFVTLTDTGELVAVESKAAATFTVNSTGDAADASPGNGVCATVGAVCTLRAAVEEANASAGADTIQFAVNPGAPSGFPQTITLGIHLPSLTEAVTITGPNSNGAAIVIQGGYSNSAAAFQLEAPNIAIRRLTLTSFDATALAIPSSATGAIVQGCTITESGSGIWIEGANALIGSTLASGRNRIAGNNGRGIWVSSGAGSGIRILGNWVGLDSAGTAAQGNGGIGIEVARGVEIGGNSPGSRNVISGNGGAGIFIAGGSATSVLGNYLGTDAAGDGDVGNLTGIVVIAGGTHLIGGVTSGLGNVVAGSQTVGLLIGEAEGPTPSVSVRGNLIGLDATGTTAVGPQLRGIVVGNDDGSTIGGSVAGARNVISGHLEDGMLLSSGWVRETRIFGNVVGLDAAQSAAVPNGVGLRLDRAQQISVGTDVLGTGGNVVAGNLGDGLVVERYESWGHTILGNRIGLSAADQPFGNGSHGILVRATPGDLRIVGGNRIAHNGGAGVALVAGEGWTPDGVEIFGNWIWANAGLAIDLGEDGPTANDPGDADLGPNGLQNHPLIDAAFVHGSQMVVQGRLHAAASTQYRLDFYESPECDSGGRAEAFRPLDSSGLVITTDAQGAATFAAVSINGTPGWWVAATATPTTAPPGGTSELSPCLEISPSELVLFADGFESGGTGAWSSAVGG